MALFAQYICQKKKSQEKEFFRKKMEKKYFSGIREEFANTSHRTNIIRIPIRKFYNSLTIPIPICTENGSANLFLFLFAGKITIR